MVKQKQPVRMGTYTNLAGYSKTPRAPRGSKKSSGRFAWWRRMSIKKRILIIALPIVLLLIAIPLVTYLMLANDIKNPERLMNRNNTGIALTDMQGKAFYSVGRAEHRNRVPLDKIADPTKKALIASEDKDFYKHGGFNVLSIGRAMFTRVGGGSTLTQQLVKNTLLSDQKSYLRKYQEVFMSIAVEQNYSKDQILDMYLNSVYFGENAFGIEDAARTYYGKEPKDLSLAESAMLIGLLPAPSAYSPISGNKEYAKQRQTTVLTRMVNNGFITEDQKKAALAVELTYADPASQNNSIAPHFAEMIIKQLSDKYGYETVMRSGYVVKTSLDTTAQQALVDNVAKGIKHVNAMGGSNASGIVIDPTTGGIRALVGSADYANEKWGKVNMVTTARQPGSSFKPIYYAYALADGVVTPATIMNDTPKDFGGGYTPRDADKNEASRGKVSVRKSLAMSLNIPSVEIMQRYTIDKSITAANNLGISAVKRDKGYGLSLALGSAEVPLQQMAHAYAAFANQGAQYELSSVEEIQDKFGKKIFSATHSSKQVITKDGAYLISNILSDNTARAPIFGSSLTINGKTVAVKTGTTNDSRDAWTIGYTPQYVVGVWVGNNDNAAMRSGGSDMAGPIWRGTMTTLLAGKQNVQFVAPAGITQRQVCMADGGLADKSGANTYNEYFLSGALPTNRCNSAPTMIDVCDTLAGKIINIDEKTYDESRQSKDTANCKPPTIEACDIKSGKVVTIAKSEYDATKYSMDTASCQATTSPNTNTGNTGNGNKVQACDTTTGKLVMVPQSQIDGVTYTTNVTNCQKAAP